MELFAKVLTHTDVERRLSCPSGCLPALPWSEGCHGIILQVKDDAGILWNFGCIVRSGVVKKPVIVSGWIQFVQSKDLHTGDIVILYKEDDIITGAHYKIEVKKSNNTLISERNKRIFCGQWRSSETIIQQMKQMIGWKLGILRRVMQDSVNVSLGNSWNLQDSMRLTEFFCLFPLLEDMICDM
ncbi:hypothetical protein REPUB_Repub04eG0064900 [Reevesia pubescens]